MAIVHAQPDFRRLFGVAVGLVCASTFAIGVTIWWLHSDAIHDASKDSTNLSVVLAEQIANSIQSIDLVLTEIKNQEEKFGAAPAEEFHRALRSEETHRILVELGSRLQQAEFITLVDRNGKVVNTTLQWPSPEIDLSDRAHFRHFRNNDDKDIFISDALTNRINGTNFISFGKRITGKDGAFLGEVLIGIKLSYFESIYKSISRLADQTFLLLRRDGTVIVRYPDQVVRAGEKIPPASPWHRLVSQGGGAFQAPGLFDGRARLMAVQPLKRYPLVVNVGVAEKVALASWRKQAMTLGIGALLLTLCSAVLLYALRKQFLRLATAKAKVVEKARELEGANAQLSTAHAQTNAALNNMSQGLIMLDSQARLVLCNKRYLEMYGLRPEFVVPGRTLREIVEHRAAVGSFHPVDIDLYLAEVEDAVSRQKGFTKVTELHDGRIISIVNEPMEGGGWVATHEDVTKEKRADERIAHAEYVDGLTGLPNRKCFYEQLEQELKRIQRGERLAVLCLDLDHLKHVNDTLGYPAGDKLLMDVADRLRACIRGIDIVARLSGDEFAIVQKLFDQPADAAALVTRIRTAIREPFDLDGHSVTVDVSVGISIAPNDATNLDELMKTVDLALYEAKNTGRGRYCFYDPEISALLQARYVLEQELKDAFSNGEFELFYQPIVDLIDDKITSFEALLRWNHPERGLVSPAEFIPVAEEMGLIISLGEWVLRAACAEAATWPENIQVSVNLSSAQLADNSLPNAVVGALASSGLRANRLELEITESALIENTVANLDTLKRLHELGVKFAMDDFGTGYSSLSYLLSFPFHKIKIDRCFIAALSEKSESHAIVRAIANLARNLELRVTAEGVETEQQLQQVRMLGCTEMQGYLFSPPRAAADIVQFFTPGTEYARSLISVNASSDRKNGKMCGIRPDIVCNHLLTGRECDVLMGIMAGDTSKESARHLNISPRTVELHRARILKKFGVKHAADLVRTMLSTGCPTSRVRNSLLFGKPVEATVAVTALGCSYEEPDSVPGGHPRARTAN
jgi:diguanylate cyclase (GGDEF)-like protein/PAS domain S-box-containing protein